MARFFAKPSMSFPRSQSTLNFIYSNQFNCEEAIDSLTYFSVMTVIERTRPSGQLTADLCMLYVCKLIVVQKKTNIIQLLLTKLQMIIQRWTYDFKRDLCHSSSDGMRGVISQK